MSQSLREGTQRGNLNPPPTTPKPSTAPPAQGNVSRETIESIKRTLYNAIDKLERMAKQ